MNQLRILLIFSNLKIIFNSTHLSFLCFFHRRAALETRNFQFLTTPTDKFAKQPSAVRIDVEAGYQIFSPIVLVHTYSKCPEQIEFCNEAVT